MFPLSIEAYAVERTNAIYQLLLHLGNVYGTSTYLVAVTILSWFKCSKK